MNLNLSPDNLLMSLGKKLRHGHAQGTGYFLDIVQRNVASAGLDMRDEGAMQFSLKRQIFLRPAALCSISLDILRQYLSGLCRIGSRGHGDRMVSSCCFYVSRFYVTIKPFPPVMRSNAALGYPSQAISHLCSVAQQAP